MLKLLICITFTCLCAFQAADISVAENSSQKGLAQISPGITANPDYVKTKSGHKLMPDIDIDNIMAQKLINNYKIKDLQSLLKTESIISIGLLLSRLGVILLIFTVMWKTINRFTLRFVGSIAKNYKRRKNSQALAKTAGPILNSILHWALICITLLIILAEIGVDIMPIIYSFSILGLAISIGSQTLVKDIISGILTLFEGIVSVGEVVQINGSVGTIEGMSLRSIEFRHGNGTMQVISFSEISSLINLSRDYSVCTIVLPVGHEANVYDVEKTYKDVFNDLKTSKEWKNQIIGDIDLNGVSSITETAIYFKASMRTKPDPYDLFGQEFRKRLFVQMKERKIPAPKFASVVIEN